MDGVAGHFGLEIEGLKSGDKVPRIAKARTVLCYVGARQHYRKSINQERPPWRPDMEKYL